MSGWAAADVAGDEWNTGAPGPGVAPGNGAPVPAAHGAGTPAGNWAPENWTPENWAPQDGTPGNWAPERWDQENRAPASWPGQNPPGETWPGEVPHAAVHPLPSAVRSRERPRLSCTDVTMRFGGLVAVNRVNLEVPPATIVGLIGPNGAGKSTLFGVLSGLLRPTEGRVAMDGKDVTDSGPELRATRGLARTFQHPELFSQLTIRDHLVLAHRAKHARQRVWSDLLTMGSLRPPGRVERRTVGDILKLLDLSGIAHRQAAALPLGIARLVELGRALAAAPSVLLLDEPSSGLDPSETERFEAVLRRVSTEHGIAILLVEHDVDLVMRLSSRVNVLDFGSLIASGEPDAIRNDPAVRAAYLGEETGGEQGTASGGGGSRSAPAAHSRPVNPVPQPRRHAARPRAVASPHGRNSRGRQPLLQVDRLSVRYGDAVALRDVSFGLGSGRVLAVLGANGAGKSSLARAVSGLVPSRGTIRFDGDDIRRWQPDRIRKAELIHLPEGRGVFRGLTVIDNLRMAAAPAGGPRARRQAVALALDMFPIFTKRRSHLAGQLSGGEQQMLSLARALATSPKLVVADEMSLGLAPKMVDQVFAGLDQARQAGVAIIMIEQYVHRALDFADECLLLQRGSVAWHGPAQEARGEVLRHYLGTAATADV